MTSIVINHFGDPDVLELTDLPVPEPGPGQVRVRVGATAVHPVDLFVRSGPPPFLLGDGEPPYVLGWDLAGTVDATGAGADRFQPGDAVVGLSRWFDSHTGTNADLVVFDESWLAPAPTSVSVAEAATLPLNAVTADRALDLLGLRTGQTLVVTGAAGAVGGFAVEMAARRGLEGRRRRRCRRRGDGPRLRGDRADRPHGRRRPLPSASPIPTASMPCSTPHRSVRPRSGPSATAAATWP